jgi:hypothetical protein
MENQSTEQIESPGYLQGNGQTARQLEAQDLHPNGQLDQSASENPNRTSETQIQAKPNREAIAVRTKSPISRPGPPKMVVKDEEIDFEPGSLSLEESFGTSDYGLATKLVTEAIGTIPNLKSLDALQINQVIAAVHGIAPRDALEGMLAVQMVSVHNVAMERLRRATVTLELGEETYVNAATKLLRAFAALVEALDRHRGKAQSAMVVEHLHVEKGAQAIVGPVTHQGSKSFGG